MRTMQARVQRAAKQKSLSNLERLSAQVGSREVLADAIAVPLLGIVVADALFALRRTLLVHFAEAVIEGHAQTAVVVVDADGLGISPWINICRLYTHIILHAHALPEGIVKSDADAPLLVKQLFLEGDVMVREGSKATQQLHPA